MEALSADAAAEMGVKLVVRGESQIRTLKTQAFLLIVLYKSHERVTIPQFWGAP